jgi:uncharacterized protein YfaS (alpha-2-macroglobulin family)
LKEKLRPQQRAANSAKESIEITFPDAVRLTLTTDKPLYQPGQSVHMRVLAFGPDNHALANVPIKVTLADDQGQTQFEDTFNTSKFGVAKADWDIPQKLQLGDVSITAEVQSDRYSGQEARSQVRISRYELPIGPANLELAQYLHPGHNIVQVVRGANSSAMNALVITSHFVAWKDSNSTAGENFTAGDTRALRLKVEYDHTDPTPDERVRCHVETQRIGFRGYGMMLAEIGLPPGSEVERESLETAKETGSIQGYEVRPDRVVFYVWPEAAGSNFEFQFRLRYRMDAMTAPSVLYDYYNPEANATVVSVRFVAH